MNKGNPFLNILPTLDLHGYTREMIYVPINEFINDNLKLRNYKILLVHGKGNGILKKEINDKFKKDKRVSKLYLSMDNEGCTIIELKKDLC